MASDFEQGTFGNPPHLSGKDPKVCHSHSMYTKGVKDSHYHNF